ncbi:MAG: iron ABC transporter permease [Trueperaceae bacterium]|nr:MAG: iron ABC transporter permease [Trueperaceae bacterium]
MSFARIARRVASPAGLALAGLVAVLLFTNALPLWRLVERAIDVDALRWLVENPQARRASVHSLRVSTLTAVLATGLGAMSVFLLERLALPGRRGLRLLLLIPLIVPPQILTIAWLGWLGPAGTVTRAAQSLIGAPRPPWTLYSEWGIVLLLTVFALPVAYLTLTAGLQRLPRSVEEAARIDGANVLTLGLRVVAPLLRPYLLASLVLTFLAALGNFGIQALLGIPARFITLPTLIYQRITSFSAGGFAQAAALALLMAIPALFVLWLQVRLNRRSDAVESQLDTPLRYPLGRWRWPAAALAWTLLGGFVTLGPFVSMLLTALTRAYGLPPRLENLDLRHFTFVLMELDAFPRALQHSLLLAGGAAVIAALMALALGYVLTRSGQRGIPLQLLVDLPYALPGIVFALALVLTWLQSPIPGLRLYGTVWLLLLAYVGHYLAFALQPLGAAWRQVDPSLEEAGRIDGASTLQVLRHVLLPIMAPTVLVAALLVFLNAFSEISISALLAGSRAETLGWLVFGLEQAGNTNQAAALSVVLVAILGVLGLVAAGVRRWARASVGPAPP